jgi:hypothetical protein
MESVTFLLRYFISLYEFLLSAILYQLMLYLEERVISKQVIGCLIKERQDCDMAKSDSDGIAIKAEHVYPRKSWDN